MNLTTSPQPVDTRPTMGTGGWLAIAFGTLAVSVPTDLLISLLFTSTCSMPADPESVLYGRVAMLVVLVLCALPWMIAVPMHRNGGHGAVIGMVALLPALGFVVHSLTVGAWTNPLCLGG